MSKKKAICLVGILLWALLLLPFFLGAPAAHPATDDFTFAAYTHPTWEATHSLPHVIKDAFSYAARTWRDWQGTFTGIVIMALNPAVFSLPHYGIHVVLLLFLNIAAVLVFLTHFFRRLSVPQKLRIPLSLTLSAVQLLFLPDIVEGIYWFNGAWFYTGANAIALLTLTLCDWISEGIGTQIPKTILAVLLLFFLGMDNYITAMMTLAGLLLLCSFHIYCMKDRGIRAAIRDNRRLLLLLLPIAFGLFLSVIAPGNSVRMATDGAHESGIGWLFSSLLWTVRDAFKYILRFLLKTPLLSLLLFLTPTLASELPKQQEEGRIPPVWACIAGFFLLLCAMIVPHMYSSGYAGSGRVINMYHDYVLLSAPLAWILILRRLSADGRARLSGRYARIVFPFLAVLTFTFCLAGGQLRNYEKLISDQIDGTQKAYIAQFQNEYALCEAAGPEDDVPLPAWTVQTVTGKPTAFADPEVWTNVSMAQYFGVHAVHVLNQ